MEILQAMRTFAVLKESDTVIEEGQKREALRGTFSIMEFDEHSKDQLDQLKEKFMCFKKELGGLDMQEFKAALEPMISKGISPSQILTTFQKMDTCDQGAVSWNEFINFAIEEHSKRLMMRDTMDEMPFGEEVHKIRHQHRDPIMKIVFMPTVDPQTQITHWNFGKYMILSREGHMSVWTTTMKNVGYADLVVDIYSDPPWFLDMVALYHNGFIAVATTARTISFYDYTRKGWCRKMVLTKLNSGVTTMSYWANMDIEKQAVLIWGDASGSVNIIEFDLSERLPMFGIAVREGCIIIEMPDVLRGQYAATKGRLYQGIHKDWIKEVRYIPEATAFVSCCIDSDTALYMSPIHIDKKTPFYFSALKGMLCFDFSHKLNVLACAGLDCNIWLYNPYIPTKAIAMMEGHINAVTHLKINEDENFSISLDLGKTIIMFNLSTQYAIQRIPGQSVRMGQYPINTLYLNSKKRTCLMGNYSLAMLKRRRVEGLQVDVRSHDNKLVGALYSPEFEQVVSVCTGSTVRVWDITTGTRVMQFDMAHWKKEQGRRVPVEIECITLTENKRRLMTAAEGIVKIWNFNVGSVLRTLDMTHSPKITCITMAKKQIYISGWAKHINVFSDFKGEEEIKKTWQTKHNEDVLSLCVLEPNLLASSSYDGSIVVWSRETTESYCKLSASFGSQPELDTSVRSGGPKGNFMAQAAELEAESDEEEGEDAFMTIGRHLRKEGGWYRLLRALKKRQIEREKRRAALERKDFSAKYKKKKKRMNLQGLSLVYESAVECMVFLESRKLIDPQTATLVAAGAECWVRFWSLHPKGGLLGQFTCTRKKLESIRCMTTDKHNEYLFTGDTMGLLRIWDIREFCNADKLSQSDREARDAQIKKDFVYCRLPFPAEQALDTMEKLREKRISVPDASQPRKNLKAPRLISSIRCHNEAIVSLEYIDARHLILTASQDLTVRLWTRNCTYIGTFGETWRPIPMTVGNVVEKTPRVPRDILRSASARSLGTLHNGHMPHWKMACYVVRRHIYEQKREKQIEEARQKMKEERRARGEPDSDDESTTGGEKPASKILGKYYCPRKRYRGPITIEDQGLPKLRIFRGACSPYHTLGSVDLYPMDPLYKPDTFFDIDARRGKKSKKSTKQMMNTFNKICNISERFGGKNLEQTPSEVTNKDSSVAPSSATLYDKNENLGASKSHPNTNFSYSHHRDSSPLSETVYSESAATLTSEEMADLLNKAKRKSFSERLWPSTRHQDYSSNEDADTSASSTSGGRDTVLSSSCMSYLYKPVSNENDNIGSDAKKKNAACDTLETLNRYRHIAAGHSKATTESKNESNAGVMQNLWSMPKNKEVNETKTKPTPTAGMSRVTAKIDQALQHLKKVGSKFSDKESTTCESTPRKRGSSEGRVSRLPNINTNKRGHSKFQSVDRKKESVGKKSSMAQKPTGKRENRVTMADDVKLAASPMLPTYLRNNHLGYNEYRGDDLSLPDIEINKKIDLYKRAGIKWSRYL